MSDDEQAEQGTPRTDALINRLAVWCDTNPDADVGAYVDEDGTVGAYVAVFKLAKTLERELSAQRQPVGGEAEEVVKALIDQANAQGWVWSVVEALLRKAAALIEKLARESAATNHPLSWNALFQENGNLRKELSALKARLDAPCEEVHKKLDSLKLLSIEAAYAELADYARDLYRKWQEAQERAHYEGTWHNSLAMKLQAAEQRADEAVAREILTLDTPERVCFYEQEFYVLSNFSSFRVTFGGVGYATSEHAYHSQRFIGRGIAHLDAIQSSRSAHDAFKYAQKHKADQRPDWDAVKVDVMREILRAKAEQHEYVRRKLLETGDRLLVENSWRDPFWGCGPNRDGQNVLGKLWMEIRTEFRARSEGEGNG